MKSIASGDYTAPQGADPNQGSAPKPSKKVPAVSSTSHMSLGVVNR